MANEYKGVSSIIPVVFTEDLSALSGEADIAPYGVANALGVVMPFDGCIVGLSAAHVVATTYDMVLSIQVSDSDEFTETLPLAANSEVSYRYMPGLYKVAAGENITVTGQWASGSVGDDAGETQVIVFVQVGSSNT